MREVELQDAQKKIEMLSKETKSHQKTADTMKIEAKKLMDENKRFVDLIVKGYISINNEFKLKILLLICCRVHFCRCMILDEFCKTHHVTSLL